MTASLAGVLHPVLLAYLVVAVVPGLALALALGLRGWLLAAAAPLITYGLVGAAASALPLAGVGWSPVTLAVLTATVAAVTALLRLVAVRSGWVRRRAGPGSDLPPWRSVHHVGVAAGVVVAAVIGVGISYAATSGFTAVSQEWDTVFHSNAIHYIASTGMSDPAALQNLNNPDLDSYYYPNGYHVLSATVVMLTSSPVPTVLDASTALFPGLLAVGMVALVRQSGGRPALAASVGLLSCAFTAFPYDVMPWGGLVPYIVAVALLPGLLAMIVAALCGAPGLRTGVAVGLAGIGVFALHPTAAVSAVVLAGALLAHLWFRRGPRLADLAVVGLAAGSAAVLGAPLLLASMTAVAGPAVDWPADLLAADAMGQLLFLSHEQPFPQYWLVGLSLVGVFRIATLRPLLWFVAGSLVFAVMFVMAASYESELVALLTRAWWNDKWRYAALWTLAAILIAGAGLVGLRDGLWNLARRVLPAMSPGTGRRLALSSAMLAAVALLFMAASDGLYRERNTARLAQSFTDGPAVTYAERAAFDELARIVPDGAIVMNDPFDGSALMWALADVRPVFASPVIALQELPTMDPNRLLLYDSFDDLDTNRDVQRVVAELDITHVVIGSGFIEPADGFVPGMRDLDGAESLRLVYRNEDSRIYEITDVGLSGGQG